MNNKLLVIEELRVSFDLPEGVARAVDGISFDLAAGETALAELKARLKIVSETSLKLAGLTAARAELLKRLRDYEEKYAALQAEWEEHRRSFNWKAFDPDSRADLDQDRGLSL